MVALLVIAVVVVAGEEAGERGGAADGDTQDAWEGEVAGEGCEWGWGGVLVFWGKGGYRLVGWLVVGLGVRWGGEWGRRVTKNGKVSVEGG